MFNIISQKEMQVKSIIRHHYISIRRAKVKKEIGTIPNAGKDVDTLDFSHIVGKECKMIQPL